MTEETENQFSHRNLSNPARNAVAIVPDDNSDLAVPTRSIYVGGAGDLVVSMVDESGATTVTFVGVPGGAVLPIQVRRVHATLTTATNLIGLY